MEFNWLLLMCKHQVNISFVSNIATFTHIMFELLENFLFLNQGKFRQNGGCGYILKPKVIRNPTGIGMRASYVPCNALTAES